MADSLQSLVVRRESKNIAFSDFVVVAIFEVLVQGSALSKRHPRN